MLHSHKVMQTLCVVPALCCNALRVVLLSRCSRWCQLSSACVSWSTINTLIKNIQIKNKLVPHLTAFCCNINHILVSVSTIACLAEISYTIVLRGKKTIVYFLMLSYAFDCNGQFVWGHQYISQKVDLSLNRQESSFSGCLITVSQILWQTPPPSQVWQSPAAVFRMRMLEWAELAVWREGTAPGFFFQGTFWVKVLCLLTGFWHGTDFAVFWSQRCLQTGLKACVQSPVSGKLFKQLRKLMINEELQPC